MSRWSERVLILMCLALAGAVFLTGIQWGLPSREADKHLFGDRAPWTGAEIMALAPVTDDPNRGADVDVDPLVGRDQVLVLNETDKQRAEIVRRYRLFTHQPDEYNTMRSLSGMSPGSLRLDPRMYQYGGLWIYPVGALLKIGDLVGYLDVRNDKTYYLDHPEQFGRFYVIARLYSAAWGIAGALAVYGLARKLAGHPAPAAVAAVCFAMLPVVVNAAHEAKPHLAGLALMLFAILAASRYVETGKRSWWLIAGALCGAAFGMVISSLIVFAILPVMAFLRPMPRREQVRVVLLSGLVGAGVYVVTNPYVPINLVMNPAVLRSNLGASTAMYEPTGGSGVVNALMLIGEGLTPWFAGAAGLWLVALLTVRRSKSPIVAGAVPGHVLLLLLVPAGIVLVQFVALAADKPAEYARFALLPDTALCVAAVVGEWVFLKGRFSRAFVLIASVLIVAPSTVQYLLHFHADARTDTSRILEARRMGPVNYGGYERLALAAEPAPYSVPPVDLWRWKLLLLPRGKPVYDAARDAGADALLRAVDRMPGEVPAGFRRLDSMTPESFLTRPAPISWAAKPFEILVAETPPASDAGGSAGPATSAPSPAPAPP